MVDKHGARFCSDICVESYEEDLDYGIIYPQVIDTDEVRRSWRESSRIFNFCAYCGTKVTPCDCGGSGYVPGVVDDEPCPIHSEGVS